MVLESNLNILMVAYIMPANGLRAREAPWCGPDKKQIHLYVPRPPYCGGKEKARDSVRDDTSLAFFG